MRREDEKRKKRAKKVKRVRVVKDTELTIQLLRLAEDNQGTWPYDAWKTLQLAHGARKAVHPVHIRARLLRLEAAGLLKSTRQRSKGRFGYRRVFVLTVLGRAFQKATDAKKVVSIRGRAPGRGRGSKKRAASY